MAMYFDTRFLIAKLQDEISGSTAVRDRVVSDDFFPKRSAIAHDLLIVAARP